MESELPGTRQSSSLRPLQRSDSKSQSKREPSHRSPLNSIYSNPETGDFSMFNESASLHEQRLNDFIADASIPSNSKNRSTSTNDYKKEIQSQTRVGSTSREGSLRELLFLLKGLEGRSLEPYVEACTLSQRCFNLANDFELCRDFLADLYDKLLPFDLTMSQEGLDRFKDISLRYQIWMMDSGITTQDKGYAPELEQKSAIEHFFRYSVW